ncbi:hypothetical protein D3C76_160340 [compost metagenome]
MENDVQDEQNPTPLARVAASVPQFDQLKAAGIRSVFDIAERNVNELMDMDNSLTMDDAQTLHQRASAMAVVVARQFREQRLTAQNPPALQQRSGVRALVDGPTFESQFNPSWASNCLPEAIEASTSPAAYLTSLYRMAIERIEPEGMQAQIMSLAERRPDLADLLLDNTSLRRVEPTLVIVNEILERAARKHLDDNNQRGKSVDDALLACRYPFALPYERYQTQINHVLQRKDYTLGDVIRRVDPDYPYFKEGGLHSMRSDDALQLDTALGPEQRALLLESPYFPGSARAVNPRSLHRVSASQNQATFFKRHYGVDTMDELKDISVFCQRTGINQVELESLLSIETCAPQASPNVPGLAAASPARFGSSYINAGSEPALTVLTSDSRLHEFSGYRPDHFDRMQRMIRLSRWLELPFDQTDQLLSAIFTVDQAVTGKQYIFTENTLRALGLFRRLRRESQVTAEDFAAFIGGVALYARGENIPQFDRVFNNPSLFSQALQLDNSAFPISPDTDEQYRKVDQLCSALGMTFETYLAVARYIAQAFHQGNEGVPDTLTWSTAVVSAFYRLVKLPAYLGITTIEAIALLQLIHHGGHQYVTRLAQPTLAVFQHVDLADTLCVIQSLSDAVRWSRENKLDVSWLYQQLMPLAPVAVGNESELDLLKLLHTRMQTNLITEATFIEAGLPMVSGVDMPTTIKWLEKLSAFISPEGLVREGDTRAQLQRARESYEQDLRDAIQSIIDNLELQTTPDVHTKLTALVMDARAAQQTMVWESLATTLGVTAEQCRELLDWAQGSSYRLLDQVRSAFADGTEGMPLPLGCDALAMLSRLSRRAEITRKLALSPRALRAYLDHPQWFIQSTSRAPERAAGTTDPDISFEQLYALVQFRNVIEFVDRSEQAVLDYLHLVNTLPEELSPADLELIREDAAGDIATFTGFGIRDILETALEVTEKGVISNVPQLDRLIRVRGLCQDLQLGTTAAIDLGKLQSNSAVSEYRGAAEGALSSLTAALNGQVGQERGELGQSETSSIVVDRDKLVAQSGQTAKLTLTVKNFLGQAIPDINVRWMTTLGRLGSASSPSTDENGQVSIELEAATQLGTAQVSAHYGLDRQIMAPLVQMDCDDNTLRFKVDTLPKPPQALAGNREDIEFKVRLLDQYENPGRDRVVTWSTDLGSFRRPQTRTDAEGHSIAHLQSLSSGQAVVNVVYEQNGNNYAFAAVKFLEQPYFQYVQFSGPIATDQPAEVTCRIVNLDGSPVVDVPVRWQASMGAFDDGLTQSRTDAEGIARLNYRSGTPGTVSITVQGTVQGQVLKSLNSEATTVYQTPKIIAHAPAAQYFFEQQAEPARFGITLEPAVARYPVTWFMGDEHVQTTTTDRNGNAQFSRYFKGSELGDQVITARTVGQGNEVVFKVMVAKAHESIGFSVPDGSTSLVPFPKTSTSRFAVDRDEKSNLRLRVVRADGTGDDNAVLSIAVEGGNPAALGITFAPPLGDPLLCSNGGYATLGIDCSAAQYLANSDPNDNGFDLVVSSNLGITQKVSIKLRDLVDLDQCEMKIIEKNDSKKARVLGYLQRVNGKPFALRINKPFRSWFIFGLHRDTSLDAVGDRRYFEFDSELTRPAGSVKCNFQLRDNLQKRIYFVGHGLERVFKADEVVRDTVKLEFIAGRSPVLDVGEECHIDRGARGQFKMRLTWSDGRGVVGAHVKLTTIRNDLGIKFAAETSDNEGYVSIDVDARQAGFNAANTTNNFTLRAEVYGYATSIRVNLRDFVTVVFGAGGRGSIVRRSGEMFDLANVYGEVYFLQDDRLNARRTEIESATRLVFQYRAGARVTFRYLSGGLYHRLYPF